MRTIWNFIKSIFRTPPIVTGSFLEKNNRIKKLCE